MKKCIEWYELWTVTQDKDFKKVYTEWSTWGKYDEPVLIDRCQYWKKQRGSKDDTWYIMMRSMHKHLKWELTLFENEEPVISITCSGYQINKVTQDLWMTSQHLRLKKADDRNIIWDYKRAFEWWKLVCFKANMRLGYSPAPEHELKDM